KDGLRLTDFYTFLALKMEPELLDEGYTNEQIRKTVQGLYDYDETENDNNFKIGDIMFNPPSADKGSRRWTDSEVAVLYGNTHVDIDFNGFLKQGVEIMAKDGEVTIEQTMILVKGDARKNVQDVRDWLNKKLFNEDEMVVDTSDYLAITFSMSMQSYVGEGGEDGEKNDAQSLFPDKIYATVVYKYDANADAGERFTVVGGISSETAPVLVFNNMDSTQYKIMVRLMGANPDTTDDKKVNMKSIANKGAEVLNSMSHTEIEIPGIGTKTVETKIEFAATAVAESGMGEITISNGTIS
ncbi:MAG: hypothetical protein K2L88_04395, partial [Clostridiales bacterium]|nr:hypothetical protein [Clostridiales bacterium]